MTEITRADIATLILKKLTEKKNELKKEFNNKTQINSCIIEDLLPTEFPKIIYDAFPNKEEMSAHRSIRENKRIAAQMNLYNPVLEEIVFAFQDNRVVKMIEEITGLQELKPDENLYAGGISLMTKGNFLNPHLDNSHDNDRENYRVLNLLYYVSPNWKLENGGNLELWDKGTKFTQRTIVSKFNRLVIMITNKSSLHSVSKVVVDEKRCCISNYYFSKIPAENSEYFHVTSFYGRPDEPIKNVLLNVDRLLRNFVRKITKKRIVKTKHIYKKK